MAGQLPDFDTLQTMARHDPTGLERLRLRLVHELIASADPARQRRLQGLQFQIDMERRRAPNPMAACIRLSTLMRDSLLRMQQALNEPRRPTPTSVPTRVPAKVLRFAPLPVARGAERPTGS